MPELFFTADTHFGHKKAITIPGRSHFSSVEEHDEAIVKNWNAVVRKHDTVWHLGDVLFGKHSFRHLARLNGIKKLVAGNHDEYATALYLEHFAKVMGASSKLGCILTHIPVSTSQFTRYRANIHGHMHHRVMDDPRYINVSLEQHGLAPVAWHVLQNRIGDLPEVQHVD